MKTWSPWIPENAPPGWAAMPAEEFGRELARSHPHYEVERLLGHGGMGAVYAALDREVSRAVAIKMLRPDALADETYLRRFDEEIASLRRVRHDNTVRILDAGTTADGYRFFVMELLEGESLAQVLAGPARLRIERVVRIMRDVCAGVQHVHEQGLVHRDLKAANIFLAAADGRAVVLDFGVAREAARPASTATRLHGTPGTHGHIAPEVRQGQSATAASDVFSLGVVFLQMVNGEVPDVGHAWPSDFGLDPRFDGVAQKALSQDPKDRYGSAAELAVAIEAAATPRAPSDSPALLGPPSWPQLAPSPAPSIAASSAQAGGSASPPGPSWSPRPVVAPPPSRLRLHQEYLAGWRPRQKRAAAVSVAPTQDERWEVIEQWNAMPDMPTFEEVDRKVRLRRRACLMSGGLAFAIGFVAAAVAALRSPDVSWLAVPFFALIAGGILGAAASLAAGWLFDYWARVTTPGPTFFDTYWNWGAENSLVLNDYWRRHARASDLDPRSLLWHPSHSHLFATRDHCHLAGWTVPRHDSIGPRHAPDRLSWAQAIFDVGSVTGVIWSETAFMVQSESFWWWRTWSATEHWIVYDRRGHVQSWISADTVYHRAFGPVEQELLLCNPFRPQSREELLVLPSASVVALCDVSGMPKKHVLRKRDEMGAFAKEGLDVGPLRLTESDDVDSYAWHPSGAYLALAIAGRVSVVHWQSGELVASHVPPVGDTYAAWSWSADGMLLALDRDTTRVLDARTLRVRSSSSGERWQVQPAASRERQGRSCDDLRSFSRWVVRHSDGDVASGLRPSFGSWGDSDIRSVRDVAWSPDDPDMFATVGGTSCPRDIRLWRRVCAAAASGSAEGHARRGSLRA